MPRGSNKEKSGKMKSLAEKTSSRSTHGFALDSNDDDNKNSKSRSRSNSRKRKRNGKKNDKSTMEAENIQRTFRPEGRVSSDQRLQVIATPAYIRRNKIENEKSKGNQGCTDAEKSDSERVPKTPAANNPYLNTERRYVPPSSAKQAPSTLRKKYNGVHIITAVSENIAKETCLAAIDAGAPTSLQCHMTANGQTYSETIDFLQMIEPHEIILNEGRKNSILCQKILKVFGDKNHEEKEEEENDPTTPNTAATKKDLLGACDTKTVIKFVPRSYFDQHRGNELLDRIARKNTFDAPVLMSDYVFTSSSFAVLQYMQVCLGADYANNSLSVELNGNVDFRHRNNHGNLNNDEVAQGNKTTGGFKGSFNSRMHIDRNTITHLEILRNTKTGKLKHSLLGTIDCTKTSVGHRLLKMNLVAPPTRFQTINSRLDMVDIFLQDEQFFYEVLDQLKALPDLDKMLAPMILVPRKHANGRSGKGSGNYKQVTSKMASKGISALVCIKTALTNVADFARVLDIELKSLVKRDKREEKYESRQNRMKEKNSSDSDENSDSDESSDDSSTSEASSITDDEEEMVSADASTLNIGLGVGPETPLGKDNANSMSNYQLLEAILAIMRNPQLQEILDHVCDIFTESTTFTKNSHAMRHQECFALKPNTDGMMDVIRKAYLSNNEEMLALVEQYSEEFGFSATLKETSARGFYIAIQKASMTSTVLPPTFVQVASSGKFINCTTEELMSLSSRTHESVSRLLILTYERIQGVMDFARERYDALASLCDAVALLDMCHSFADLVASNSGSSWCRPVLNDCSTHEKLDQNNSIGSGCIAIRNGRYAIDVSSTGLTSSAMGARDEYIPNDSYASAFQNFTVITGINGSGKSTYLKQLAITVILAQCGCYVPAEEAFIPIRDRLCTRIGNTDDQEHNISTFMQEMKDTAYICRNATEKSLILIDELGRATSNEDGVAIAWAVAEFLLVKRSMSFFVTHYPQLCRLAEVYPNVQNQHLGAVADDSGEVRYLHKILPGSCKMSADYGVEMAASCGWQADVVEMAREYRKLVEKKLPEDMLCNRESGDSAHDIAEVRAKAENLLNDLAKHLVALKASEDRLSNEARRQYLQDLHNQYALQDDPNVTQMMKKLLLDDQESAVPCLPLEPDALACIVNSIENEETILEQPEDDESGNDQSDEMEIRQNQASVFLDSFTKDDPNHANGQLDSNEEEKTDTNINFSRSRMEFTTPASKSTMEQNRPVTRTNENDHNNEMTNIEPTPMSSDEIVHEVDYKEDAGISMNSEMTRELKTSEGSSKQESARISPHSFEIPNALQNKHSSIWTKSDSSTKSSCSSSDSSSTSSSSGSSLSSSESDDSSCSISVC